ncbi:MAG: FHA domain-containing protein [Clostridia bacterium]|nr:FHA domain-containing protein [Clostridia bacterium]
MIVTDLLAAYGGLLLRILLSVSIFGFLFTVLLLLFNRNYGKNVIARFINAANGDTVDVSSWEVSIGRAKTCDIVLNYPTVSRFHAVVVRRGKGWLIFDTNSKTGVRVNGEKIDRSAFIYDGDIISMGTAVLSFRSPLFKRPAELQTPAKQVPYRNIGDDRRVVSAARKSAGAPISALRNLADNSLILLFADDYVIGRSPGCGIVLPVMTVSRRHARLAKQNGMWTITDLGSRSGTGLNGGPVKGTMHLRDGYVIEIGGVCFRFIARYMND